MTSLEFDSRVPEKNAHGNLIRCEASRSPLFSFDLGTLRWLHGKCSVLGRVDAENAREACTVLLIRLLINTICIAGHAAC